MSRLKDLIHEVHRRSLWQVLALYLAGSWVVLQVVNEVAESARLPDWVSSAAFLLLLIGFPIVLATAFVQEGVGGREASGSSGDSGPEGGDPGEAEGVDAPPTAAGRGHHRLFTWRNAIGGGVVAFALWGVAAAGWMLFGPSPESSTAAESAVAPARSSIAVLPFASAHTDEQSQAFTSGIHDDILTQLSKIAALEVIARTSVMQYRDTEKTIPEIAGELGVATVLEGRVQRAGERVRVNAQLIDAKSGAHLWAETYDRELTVGDLFAIQTDVARNIARALEAALAPEEEAVLKARPTESLEAYDLYTRAQYLARTGGNLRGELTQTARLLERAIAADPSYALAHAALGRSYLHQWDKTFLSPAEALPAARRAIERALELAPELAEAHVARGQLLEAELRMGEAEEAYRRALELAPGLAEAHAMFGRFLFTQNRYEESIPETRRAVELDPLSVRARLVLGDALWWAREWDASIAETRKVLEMDPNHAYAYYNLGYAHAMKGEDAEAVAALERARALGPDDPFATLGLAWAHAHAGRPDTALALLATVPEQGSSLREFGLVHAALGDLDRAFEYLERAFEENPGSLRTIPSDATADPLRDDPRYHELMKKLGLE